MLKTTWNKNTKWCIKCKKITPTLISRRMGRNEETKSTFILNKSLKRQTTSDQE